MKHIPPTIAEIKQNSDSCEVKEFGNIGAIDGADIAISGRYPEHGYAINEKSDMVVRVLTGSGTLTTRHQEATLTADDVVFVEHGEAYYFVGQKLKLFMACSPTWSHTQYKEIKE